MNPTVRMTNGSNWNPDPSEQRPRTSKGMTYKAVIANVARTTSRTFLRTAVVNEFGGTAVSAAAVSTNTGRAATMYRIEK